MASCADSQPKLDALADKLHVNFKFSLQQANDEILTLTMLEIARPAIPAGHELVVNDVSGVVHRARYLINPENPLLYRTYCTWEFANAEFHFEPIANYTSDRLICKTCVRGVRKAALPSKPQAKPAAAKRRPSPSSRSSSSSSDSSSDSE